MKRSEFSAIPDEVIFHRILPYFEYRWILNVGRLVCKYWNENYKSIETFDFSVNYYGNDNYWERLLNDVHSGELEKVTGLNFRLPLAWNYDLELQQKLITKLSNLKELSLGPCACEYPLIMTKLEHLERVVLNLRYINIVEFLKNCKSKIKSFDISSVEYKQDFSFDIEWPLEHLSVSGLSTNSWISLLNSKFARNSLKSLKICNCGILPNEAVFDLIGNLDCLTELDCSEKVLWKHMRKIGKLKKLTCNKVFRGAESELDLSLLTNLEYLCLMSNDLVGSSFKHLQNMNHLTELILANNKIENAAALSSVTSLTHLDLSNNYIRDEGLKDFCQLVNLKYLSLEYNQIGSIGANYLSKIVQLEQLNLARNYIGEIGVENYGNLQALRILNLNANNIGDGLKFLACCNSLNQLYVASNKISSKGLIDFCKVSMPNLKVLTISNNNVGKAVALLVCFKGTEVRADNCNIGLTDAVQYVAEKGISSFSNQLINTKNKLLSIFDSSMF
ncbi:predicted protein [Naegleria gruberi]|uniref:Predicted protein n=1 Tax=Naegleria gruberi TaxID=5762 RepID=D2W1K1_NAEGR|nr:uncharacterized protein NAEGRDRAFT_75249 [Naegleria gruberi]EFC37060.1 predicted protein [Naegleria gruberi]|eukprot:XP_002669804.1 predicted protein [Naegleria gruberi strain NEG-M]